MEKLYELSADITGVVKATFGSNETGDSEDYARLEEEAGKAFGGAAKQCLRKM
jgi:hypothetical protein